MKKDEAAEIRERQMKKTRTVEKRMKVEREKRGKEKKGEQQ